MIYRFGPFELDLARHELREDGVARPVEPQVFALIALLVENRERLLSRDELLEKVWDMHFDPESNVVDVHVGNLRRKLKRAVGTDLIETVRGVGFRLQLPDRVDA